MSQCQKTQEHLLSGQNNKLHMYMYIYIYVSYTYTHTYGKALYPDSKNAHPLVLQKNALFSHFS